MRSKLKVRTRKRFAEGSSQFWDTNRKLANCLGPRLSREVVQCPFEEPQENSHAIVEAAFGRLPAGLRETLLASIDFDLWLAATLASDRSMPFMILFFSKILKSRRISIERDLAPR
ncbi:hypothetical protein [Ruegeria sp. HKCCSP351]|uniref:hypothetical protein n=1 Tax=Ruegeria sp. HKCCSP351 TaxID=2794832 RepID=UPI001AE15438|nr:hypothetical protein [Ruegeria sp. HKCCSP351]